MPTKDLSVIIPSRQEKYLGRTIQNILDCAEMNTEVIAVLDGYLPDPPLEFDSERFRWLYFEQPIGQRGATNKGVEASTAKYVAKLDAHCAVDQGFDRKLIEPYESGEIGMDVTTIPRMYYLHVFDWVCDKCGARYYQADPVPMCLKCHGETFHEEMVWKPRWEKGPVDFGRFDYLIHWQYWPRYTRRRPEAEKADIADVMSAIGACFFMPRARFHEIDGLDEAHGFWGQFGAEISCKSWLSGGRQVVNKRTWYAHFFRVGKLGFPYQISGDAQERAKIYSRNLWMNNLWDKQTRPLSWLVDHFWPVRGWDRPEAKEVLDYVRKAGEEFYRKRNITVEEKAS